MVGCPSPAWRKGHCLGVALGSALIGPEDVSLFLPVSSEKSLEQELAATILDIEDLVRRGNEHR